MKKGKVDLISGGVDVDKSLYIEDMVDKMSKELEQSEKIFEVIKMLMEFGEKELAFQLRVAHDTHLRSGWKNTT